MDFSVSLMCIDFLKVEKQLTFLNKRANYYHVDIMDGHFCKNLTLSPDFVRAVGRIATLPMDVHLMTETPMDWIDVVAKAGATYISPHAETINTDAFRVLNHIESFGCKTGVVLNPATPLENIQHYINRIDMLTIMTVDVGYAGQPFIPEMLHKIKRAQELRQKNGYKYQIQVDGSCNANTYAALTQAGADILVMGSTGLFGLDKNLERAYDKMAKDYVGAINQPAVKIRSGKGGY